jgi:hypothetical protein
VHGQGARVSVVGDRGPASRQPLEYSDYVVYVDESGDHGLVNMDPDYPIFVLAFCVFEKRKLAHQIVPAVLRFKFAHFGHDQVILHEHDIRKSKGPFSILLNAGRREAFYRDLNTVIVEAEFTIVAVVIRKAALTHRYSSPSNPYALAMEFGLERVCAMLEEKGQAGRLTHFVFESRGAREDAELELEFRRVSAPGSTTCRGMPVDLLFADKKTISTGLQLADLVARPIGLHVLRPTQVNRAFEMLRPKLRRSPKGWFGGWGLKVFP